MKRIVKQRALGVSVESDYHSRLRYDGGRLYWRDGPRAGKEAGTLDPTTGYKVFRLAGKKLLVHRVVWGMLANEVPKVIDHINQDKTDNRYENLRNCDQKVNQHNRRGPKDKDNTSGRRGVSWDKEKGKWEAYITVGRRKHLGYYDELNSAIEARKEAENAFEHIPTRGS